MTTIEKIAFLKGLYEGATQDLSINENKLFRALIGVVNEMAVSIAEVKGNVTEMNGKIDEIDEDLSYLEEEFFNRGDEDGVLFDNDDYDVFEKSMDDYFDSDLKVVEFSAQGGSVPVEEKEQENPVQQDSPVQEELEAPVLQDDFDSAEEPQEDYVLDVIEETDELSILDEIPEEDLDDEIEIEDFDEDDYPELIEPNEEDDSEFFAQENEEIRPMPEQEEEEEEEEEADGLSVVVTEEFDEEEQGSFDDEDDEEIFIEACPNCDGELRLTYEVLQDGSCECPGCHETLYFEILDDE